MANEPISAKRSSRSSTGAESISSTGSGDLDLTALREEALQPNLNAGDLSPVPEGPSFPIRVPPHASSQPGRGSALPVPGGEAKTKKSIVSLLSERESEPPDILEPHKSSLKGRGSALPVPGGEAKNKKSVVSLLSERDAEPPIMPLLGRTGSIESAFDSHAGESFEIEEGRRRSSGERVSTRRSVMFAEGSFAVSSVISSEADTPEERNRRRLYSTATCEGGLMDAAGEIDLQRFKASPSDLRNAPPPPRWMSEATNGSKEDNSLKGRYFDRTVWAYYTHSGRWSDGMGAPVQDGYGMLCCCCPPLWPIRLFLTLRRAIPVRLRLACCQCHLRPEAAITSAGALTLVAAAMVFVPVGLLAVLLYTNIEAKKSKETEVIPWREVLSSSAPGIGVLAAPWLLGLFLWAAIFQAIGWKYNILDSQKKPLSFLAKACCCLAAMNVRVGFHVDRAQGFRRPNKYVRQMLRMSECVRGIVGGSFQPGQPPPSRVELSPVQHSISGDVLADDNIRQAVEGAVRVEEHAKRLSQGRPSRTPFLFE